jgi:hypothetical protein
MANATADIVSVIDNRFIALNYQCRTEHVSYSIADYVGNIVKRGGYDCIINHKIDIQSIPKGIYVLCIIDGDSLTKLRFQKN